MAFVDATMALIISLMVILVVCPVLSPIVRFAVILPHVLSATSILLSILQAFVS